MAQKKETYGDMFVGCIVILCILLCLTCFGTGIWGFIKLIMYWTTP